MNRALLLHGFYNTRSHTTNLLYSTTYPGVAVLVHVGTVSITHHACFHTRHGFRRHVPKRLTKGPNWRPPAHHVGSVEAAYLPTPPTPSPPLPKLFGKMVPPTNTPDQTCQPSLPNPPGNGRHRAAAPGFKNHTYLSPLPTNPSPPHRSRRARARGIRVWILSRPYLSVSAIAQSCIEGAQLQGGSISRSGQTRSLISAVTILRQNIGPRLTAHQNDQHGKPEVASDPESCARAKRGRDGARRSGEAGRASS